MTLSNRTFRWSLLLAASCLFSQALFSTALFSTALFSTALAQETPTEVIVPAVSARDYYAPSAMPDRIVLSFHVDAKTSRSVNWRTSTEVTTAFVELAPAEAGPKFVDQAVRFPAATEALTSDLGAAHFHSAVFENLLSGSWYAYRVGDGTNWSEWIQFQTTPAELTAFSFSGNRTHDARTFASAQIACRRAVLLAGEPCCLPESRVECK